MVITPRILMLSALCITAGLATVVLIWAALSQPNRLRRFSERALGALVCTCLVIVAEMRLVSLVPMQRPLDWLPPAHCIAAAGAAVLLTFRRGARFWTVPAREAWQSVCRLWKETGWPLHLAAALTAAILAALFVFGMFIGMFGWDEMAYHAPQAIQPYQDGRVGGLDSPLPWTYLYPKGAAMVWSWTMLFTGSDILFHAVQLAFGLQLLLAVYLLAVRSGARRGPALSGAFAIGWMPIFLVLTTAAGADIGFAAACIAMVAFAAPREGHALSYVFATLCLLQAALIKMPVTALLFAAAAATGAILSVPPPRLKTLHHACRSPWLRAGAVVVAIAAAPYAVAWVGHGNPMYPIKIAAGGRVLFDGPVPTVQEFLTTHTSFSNVPRDSLVRTYHMAWADWFTWLNYDSAGSTGPVVLTAALFLALASAVFAARKRDFWLLALGAAIILGMLLLGSYHPRYGVPITALIVVCAVVFLSRLNEDARAPAHAAFAILALSAVPFVVWNLNNSVRFLASFNGGLRYSALRVTRFQETVQTGTPGFYPTPEMVSAIRRFSRKGDLLAWNVTCFHALLWNREYSNRTLYLSGTARDRFPAGPEALTPLMPAERERWRADIERIKPDQVLVYTHSDYARIIEQIKEPAYGVLLRDPGARGRGGMTLFQRM